MNEIKYKVKQNKYQNSKKIQTTKFKINISKYKPRKPKIDPFSE